MTSGIYAIINKVNNHRYIGSSQNIEFRWYEHKRELRKNKHHSIALQRAWNKYGENSFQFKILIRCNPNDLLDYEQRYLDKHPEYNIALYSKAPMRGRKHKAGTFSNRKDLKGNQYALGYKHSEEEKKKISLAGIGRIFSKERREKISKALKGKKKSPEARKNISIAHLGNNNGHGNLGRKTPEDIKKKLSIAAKKHWQSLKENNNGG